MPSGAESMADSAVRSTAEQFQPFSRVQLALRVFALFLSGSLKDVRARTHAHARWRHVIVWLTTNSGRVTHMYLRCT